MNITTESDCIGVDPNSPLAAKFHTLKYQDGSHSNIPKGFFRDWLDNDILEGNFGSFSIGRGSGIGVGSIAKYDSNNQSLRIGRYVSGGLRLRFLLNGQHEIGSISTSMFSTFGNGFTNPPMPQYGDTVLKNDVWVGDEALFLGGSCVEDGCVIGARAVVPPNFRSEPYGIYVGSPARLVRFRFSEKIRQALVALAWWEMPLAWVKENNQSFMPRISEMEEGAALELLQKLQVSKQRYQEQHNTQP